MAQNILHWNGQDSLVQPLLTDFYQVNMCYAYWKSGTTEHPACFDVFFRKNPFHGEFTVFAGLEDCIKFVQSFKFQDSDIQFLKQQLTHAEPAFFDYLKGLDCSKLKLYGVDEGTIVFPRVPLITVEGPLALCQLMETTLLNLVNFASLVATNAARLRNVAGERVQLMEFGLRRAQGPNGGLTASKYSYVGGFHGTSNTLAGKLFGIPVAGTQAHSFVCSFESEEDLANHELRSADGSKTVDFVELAKEKLAWLLSKIDWGTSRASVSPSELVAFCAYAIATPDRFFALIDTYDTLKSGLPNFCAVSLALHDLGYQPQGCRLDSGDLSYLSKEVRARFCQVANLDEPSLKWVESLKIMASNDLNEETIISLNEQHHEIDSFGVGTHLVTCQRQPALGCVYKLVTICDRPRIKLSQDVSKVTIPGRKSTFRLYSKKGYPLIDLIQLSTDPEPVVGKEILCRHPFEESKRAIVVPAKVQRLQKCYWADNKVQVKMPTLVEVRQRVRDNIAELREDHKRILNPTPYKIAVSENLYNFLHTLWLDNAPIGQLD